MSWNNKEEICLCLLKHCLCLILPSVE